MIPDRRLSLSSSQPRFWHTSLSDPGRCTSAGTTRTGTGRLRDFGRLLVFGRTQCSQDSGTVWPRARARGRVLPSGDFSGILCSYTMLWTRSLCGKAVELAPVEILDRTASQALRCWLARQDIFVCTFVCVYTCVYRYSTYISLRKGGFVWTFCAHKLYKYIHIHFWWIWV